MPPVVKTKAVEDPDAEYIVYREPIVNQVDIPGQGPTAVQSYKEHRVLLSEWPAYEQALNESKKGL